MTEAPAMLSTRDTLSSVLNQMARRLRTQPSSSHCWLLGWDQLLVAPLLQELTGTSLLGCDGLVTLRLGRVQFRGLMLSSMA